MRINYKKKRKILSALFGVLLIENLNSVTFSENSTENVVQNELQNNSVPDSLIRDTINVKNKQNGIKLYEKALNIALESTSMGAIVYNLNSIMNNLSTEKKLDTIQISGKLRLLYDKYCINCDTEQEKSILKKCYNYAKLVSENKKNNMELTEFTDDNYAEQVETSLVNQIVDLWSTYDPEMKNLSEHEIYEEFIKKKDITNTNSWIERFNGFKEFLCTDIPLGCCGSIRNFFKNAQYILYNLDSNS